MSAAETHQVLTAIGGLHGEVSGLRSDLAELRGDLRVVATRQDAAESDQEAMGRRVSHQSRQVDQHETELAGMRGERRITSGLWKIVAAVIATLLAAGAISVAVSGDAAPAQDDGSVVL